MGDLDAHKILQIFEGRVWGTVRTVAAVFPLKMSSEMSCEQIKKMTNLASHVVHLLPVHDDRVRGPGSYNRSADVLVRTSELAWRPSEYYDLKGIKATHLRNNLGDQYVLLVA